MHGFLSNKNRRIPLKIKFGGPPKYSYFDWTIGPSGPCAGGLAAANVVATIFGNFLHWGPPVASEGGVFRFFKVFFEIFGIF